MASIRRPDKVSRRRRKAPLTPVNATCFPGALNMRMTKDFPIKPPLVVKDVRKRKLRSIAEARDFVEELLRQRRFVKFREMLRRLKAVKTEDEAIEASGALRELLKLEHLLVIEERGPAFVRART